MHKLNIGIIDLIAKAPTRALWARAMHPNFASIMPQVIATWCEGEGHNVRLVCYTGYEDIVAELPDDLDIVFIGTFTEAAQLSYSLSSLFRSRGVLTAIGGPHARCYPQDAQKYFDYVLGFTDQAIIRNVLEDCSPHRPLGIHLSAEGHPAALPGVQERWKFIEPTLDKAHLVKIVPMIGSLGCPYSCSFCIDAGVPYQPLDFEVIKADLRFLLKKYKKLRIGWHDPNFGIRFNDYMEAIEEVVPPGRAQFVAESSLALLTEPRVRRLKSNGFMAILPGIESWFDMGQKSRTGQTTGIEKVHRVAEQINMIMGYIPYMQTNFIIGLDVDWGREPYELTKRFLDLAPGAFPAYSLMSAFGQAAQLNLELQRDGRILPFPFHFLNNNHAMNVRPMNYSWPEFYDNLIDLSRFSFSWRMIFNRLRAVKMAIPRWLNVVRAVSSEGFGRIKYYVEIRRLLEEDRQFRAYFEQETTELPQFFIDRVRTELGPMWEWLPEGAMYHDPYAYLKEEQAKTCAPMTASAA